MSTKSTKTSHLDPEAVRQKVAKLIKNFEAELRSGELRTKVLALIPVSKSTWWNGCRDGRYPRPVKLGPRTTAWRASDIEAASTLR